MIAPLPRHGDIAARAATARETVARVLGTLARKQLLSRESERLLITDVRALTRMLRSVRVRRARDGRGDRHASVRTWVRSASRRTVRHERYDDRFRSSGSGGHSAARPDSLYTRIKRRFATSLPVSSSCCCALVLAGLPLAVWLDLREMSEGVVARPGGRAVATVIGTHARLLRADNVVGAPVGTTAMVAAAELSGHCGRHSDPGDAVARDRREALGQKGATNAT